MKNNGCPCIAGVRQRLCATREKRSVEVVRERNKEPRARDLTPFGHAAGQEKKRDREREEEKKERPHRKDQRRGNGPFRNSIVSQPVNAASSRNLERSRNVYTSRKFPPTVVSLITTGKPPKESPRENEGGRERERAENCRKVINKNLHFTAVLNGSLKVEST